MQRREKLLLVGLVAIVILYQGARILDSWLLQPLRERQEEVTRLENQVETKTNDLITLARQKKNLDAWKRRSLPLDKSNKKRPDAVNAQRLYRDWLHDLAQLSGFEDLKVQAGRMALSRDSVYVSVGVTIEAEARYEQICRFLDRFYRTDLMHRVTALKIQSRESQDDPIMQISLDAEGLAIVGGPDKRLLFPQSILAADLSEDDTTLTIKAADDFPTEPGFLIRIRDEIVAVTALNGTQWTVERGQDGTTAASHTADSLMELMPLLPQTVARSAEEIKQLVAASPFIIPAPPVQYKPRVAPIGEKTLTRGRPLEFTVVMLGYDPARGRPEFSLGTSAPPGSRIDRGTGKFSWNPTTSQKAGKYTVPIVIKHPSLTGGQLTESVAVTLRDPNTAPRVTAKSAPPVFIGRPWTFTLSATDAETQPAGLTWKLGDNPPKGLTLSSSGELAWTPDETTDVGSLSVPVTVTDDGAQPQSTSYSLPLTVQDDLATFTYLTTIFSVGSKTLAKLYDRSQDKQIELRVGSRFAIADIQGVVTQIERKQLMFTNSQGTHRLLIGQSLREFTTLEAAAEVDAIPDATQPANRPLGADRPITTSRAEAPDPENTARRPVPAGQQDSDSPRRQDSPSPASTAPTPTRSTPPPPVGRDQEARSRRDEESPATPNSTAPGQPEPLKEKPVSRDVEAPGSSGRDER